MISFLLNGVPLVLMPQTQADLDLTGIIESLEMRDDFALPLEVPVEGNEATLGHVHNLALRQRVIILTGASLRRNGVHKHAGVFYVEGSSPTVVRLTFTVDGVLGAMKEDKLADLDLGEPIRFADLRAHAETANTLNWPATPYAFPTFLNEELYGSENPSWFPSIDAFQNGVTYSINDRVTYPSGSPVRRTRKYASLGTYSGDPINFPSHWQEISFGIVNRWDPVAQEFYENTTSASYYAMVPCFYLKELLTRAMAAHGYTVEGTFMENPFYDKTILFNNTALDGESRSYYFRVEQNVDTVTTGTANVDHPIPAQDETTPPNEDTGTVWNNTTWRWTVPAAGNYHFRVRVNKTSTYSDTLTVAMVDSATDLDFLSINVPGGASNHHDKFVDFNVQFDVPDIGNEYYFSPFGPFDGIVGASVTLSGCWIEGWKAGANAVNGFSNYIDPADHVPDLTAAEFLLEVATTFCLRIRPDSVRKVIRLDQVVDSLATTVPALDITAQVRSVIELEHVNRPTGITLAFDSDATDLGLEKRWLQGWYDTEEDLVAPVVPSAYAIVRNTRQVFLCGAESSGYYWYPSGWHIPEVLTGAERDSETITSNISPVVMERVFVDTDEYLVPQINEAGNSRFFRLGGNAPKLRMATFHGLVTATTGSDYPFASPLCMEPDGTPIGDIVLDFSDADNPNLLTEQWEAWINARLHGEELVCDIEVSDALLNERAYEEPLIIKHQRCLLLTMPITYTTENVPVIAQGTRLLKLPKA